MNLTKKQLVRAMNRNMKWLRKHILTDKFIVMELKMSIEAFNATKVFVLDQARTIIHKCEINPDEIA